MTILTLVTIIALLEGVAIEVRNRRGYRLSAVVVRCQEGHLVTTIWIPSVSSTAVHVGLEAVQRCPRQALDKKSE